MAENTGNPNGYGAKEYVAFNLAEQISEWNGRLRTKSKIGNTTSICLRNA